MSRDGCVWLEGTRRVREEQLPSLSLARSEEGHKLVGFGLRFTGPV